MQYLYKNYSSEFIIEPTKYSKYYQLIIDKALNEQRTKLKKDHLDYIYYEKHHILPRSLFPDFSKDKWNFVLLTAKEHLLVHHLLWKHFRKLNSSFKNKMLSAYRSMFYFQPNAKEPKRLNLRLSSLARQEFKGISNFKTKNPMHNMTEQEFEIWKSKVQEGMKSYRSSELFKIHQQNRSEQMKLNNPMFKLTDEQKIRRSEKISKSLKIAFKDVKRENEYNPNAKIVGLFDENDNLIQIFRGTFIEFIKTNKSVYPTNAFYESLIYSKKVFDTPRGKSLSIKMGFEQYTGWYAKYLKYIDIQH